MSTVDVGPDTCLRALRAGHDRLCALAADLDAATLRSQSYDDGWSVADVLSHLGSQGEIFGRFLEAGLSGAEPPGIEQIKPIWARWDAMTPEEQRDASAESNEAFVSRVEGLDADEALAFGVPFFGTDRSLDELLRMRLAEHAVHSWDVAVVLEASSVVAPDAVPLLIDGLDLVASRTGRTDGGPFAVRVTTTEPERVFVVDVGDAVVVRPAGPDGGVDAKVDGQLALAAEAFLRLVYGRLDPQHTPDVTSSGVRGLDDLRAAFPGV